MGKHLHCLFYGLFAILLPARINNNAPVKIQRPTKQVAVIPNPVLKRTHPVSVFKKRLLKYGADIPHGEIGVANKLHLDNAYDNVFHIWLSHLPLANEAISLQYKLKGVANHTAIARSINDAQSTGGYFVQLNDQWTNQKEFVSATALHKGDNVIRFGLPANAGFSYEVNDVALVIGDNPDKEAITLNMPEFGYFGAKAYLTGILNQPARLFCNDQPVEVRNGEFEAIAVNPAGDTGPFTVTLKAVLQSGKIVTRNVNFNTRKKADLSFVPEKKGISKEAVYKKSADLYLDLSTRYSKAAVTIPAGALPSNARVSITALRDEDLPPVGIDMVNVTGGAKAYRFLPHGSKFTKPVHLQLPIDSALLPDGYTKADIHTFYFEEITRTWVALPPDSAKTADNVVGAVTTHFTDMIAGIIKVPESPQTQGYTPTSIKDYKAADPSAEIEMIAPPTANAMGSTLLSFPIKLPKGRAGLQPNLNLQYNNEGGNGILGLGWNLTIPAIDIDTRWGVPRYDAAQETETYTMNGEQLAPLANRTDFVPRVAERQFHPRVEGSFQKIIRHGNSPANYWWEVTNKNGVRSCYGGTRENGLVDGAVLKDAAGNVAKWALVETRDLHNNYVHYFYTTQFHPGVTGGTVQGSQLYIDKINYTGNGTTEGLYGVKFHIGNSVFKRNDIEISGRLGFKMVTANVLDRIDISLKDAPIRSYTFDYREGEFSKTLLKVVNVLDGKGHLFYTHQFDYYDDVDQGNGTRAYLGNTENWSPANDNIHGDLINPVPGFTDESSALSTVKSSAVGGSLAVTIGFGETDDKRLSVGGGVGYQSGSNEGLVTMVDINGDGLPDKIIKKDGILYYRANKGLTDHSFGDLRPINGISSFSGGESKTSSFNVQAIPFDGFVGYEHSTTTNTTHQYFADFNGDGLIDLASNGQVYFNHLDANGDPVFELTSTRTPSPISPVGGIDKQFLAPDLTLQQMQETNFPLQDAIRVWQAPFDGQVSINAPVQLLNTLSSGVADRKQDGVRASIQVSGNVVWSTAIPAGDFGIKNPTGVTNLNVKKGQRIYFRVQSVYNGNGDVVSWNPTIDYQNALIPATDANHRMSAHYNATDDFILDNKKGVFVTKDGTVKIDGSFLKSKTSDSVRLLVKDVSSTGTSIVFTHVYAPIQTANTAPILSGVTVHKGDTLKFYVQSDSYIDRAAARWAIHYVYTAFADGSPATNTRGGAIIEGFAAPDNINFNDWHVTAAPFSTSTGGKVAIKAKITGAASATGKIVFTIKGRDTVYAKQSLQISGGVITGNPDSIRLILNPNQPYYFDYSATNRTMALALTKLQAAVTVDSTYFVGSVLTHKAVNKTVNASLYTNPAEPYLGAFFRGWGQFSFKGSKGGTAPLDEFRLNTNQYQNYPTDPSAYTDTTSLNTLKNPTGADFVVMYPDAKRNVWVGNDTSVYVAPGLVSSSRLFLHDVSVDSLMAGAALQAAEKINTSSNKSYTLGFGANASYSSSTNTTQLDMMDMNGDHYPDVLNENNVQYTQPSGSLEGNVHSPHNMGGASGEGTGFGISLGNEFLRSSDRNTTSENANVVADNSGASLGFPTGSANSNKQETDATWVDINGDGLPDKVYKNGLVALNLGYQFANAENWGLAAIDKNSSASVEGGEGLSLFGGSFVFGFGLNRSAGTGSYMLSDVNGDGLIDQVYTDGVQLNTGSGFNQKISWSSLSDFNNNVSTGESINAAFTVIIPIPIPFFPIKICINPSINASHGVSREKDQIMDIDGDGLPDILHSDNDGDLQVRRSLIGRTNMLKTVRRPMGGYFTVDYKRTGNSYLMPQNKWVLDAAEVFDGIAGNANGVDIMRTNFAYADGRYNRREREFYGFGTVTTNQLNTAKQNAVYRSTVQQFITTAYYAKGLLKSEVVQDADGNKFTETDNLYDLRTVVDSVQFPALVQTSKLFYEGQATAGVSTATKFDYDNLGNVTSIYDQGDGTANDLVMATVTYQNNDPLYIKNIPASIVVNTTEGLKRKRTTVIDGFGDITKISQYLADGTSAVYDMKYDAYGNLSQITRPTNDSNKRMFYAYTYDNLVNSYITKVTDAYGYSSTSAYNYSFGIATKTVSLNNEPMRIGIDSVGRITSVTGPYELASGDTTIRFEYFPNADVPYAITHHFDPQYGAKDNEGFPNDINIVTFMDGLGRAIQVKKQVSLYTGKNKPDQLKMAISGRVLYDAFGRAVTHYYPNTEPISGNNGNFNPSPGNLTSNIDYDILDRPLKEVLADGATTKMDYTIASGLIVTTTTDALHNSHATMTDVRGRKREDHALSGPTSDIVTKFDYDALSELTKVTDNGGNATTYTYDNLGRKISATYPDAGLISFVYDLAGNLTQKTTAQLRNDIPKDGGIKYQYEYERLSGIDYPEQYQNKVTYKYGSPATGKSQLQDDRAGRLVLQEDATGGQEFYYGKLGEVTKQIRTVMVSSVFYTTYVSQQKYDTWNRLTQMIYPDSEVVNYHYNRGGTLDRISGSKEKASYKYVNQLGYDEYEQRVYLQYGNGTETHYAYDNLRRRLVNLTATTASGTFMMDNSYAYDAVSNILSIANNAKPAATPLGGTAIQNYKYDGLYRLVSANGSFHGADSASYTLAMGYDNLYNVTSKKLSTQQNATNPSSGNYSQDYSYTGTVHQPITIGSGKYTYDLNGNQSTITNPTTKETRENFWDEDNRLQRTIDKGLQCLYTYDASGERVIKSSGGVQANYINSAIAGTINHYDNYTVYVSPYLVCRRTSFTKHIYIESQRIATKIGNGVFTDISNPQARPPSALSAGSINYIARAKTIEAERLAYYKTQGLPLTPGPPTNKLFYYEPVNSHIAPPVLVDTVSATPAGWPGNMTPPPTGPPITAQPIPTNDSVKAGYGFLDTTRTKIENNQYFYHSDHLGSTAYVTDAQGSVSQHEEYIPFGETYYDKHISSYSSPYLFNAKELDAETGLYYYGARYYNPQQSQWISADPMVDKYPGLSPYNYTLDNPVRLIDPNGKEDREAEKSVEHVNFTVNILDDGVSEHERTYLPKSESKLLSGAIGNSQIKYPVNGGAASEPISGEIAKGYTLSRYGGTSTESEYFSPKGTTLEQRNLLEGTNTSKYEEFEVLKSFNVEQSQIAGENGQKTGGIQFRSTLRAGHLIENGYIRPTLPTEPISPVAPIESVIPLAPTEPVMPIMPEIFFP
ncbi:SpvB/TcaC N-terminal domain-containing protein [Mucilaginibacter sp.]|uniref:SpvB/TcaC N-terminal domain-containing protein n=1 Tax=Mucilaginibacter sp. TaxID=1882438 RepID=UPI0025DDC2D5|nr:SpvB/TcaC N-terminal domain-containing protein [Mucilaginibacter sp.]